VNQLCEVRNFASQVNAYHGRWLFRGFAWYPDLFPPEPSTTDLLAMSLNHIAIFHIQLPQYQ